MTVSIPQLPETLSEACPEIWIARVIANISLVSDSAQSHLRPGDLRLATLLEFAISHRLHERAGSASVDSRATTSELDIQDALLAARIRAAHARLSHSRPAPLNARAPSLQLSGSAVLDVAVTRGVSHPNMHELVAALLLRRHERGVGSQIARFAHGVRAWSPKASPLGQCWSATEFAFVTV
ncbi:hypothetical protein B0H13DRAFT_2305292 [Mycena leptocephala]|nr:hypothetical protein B0H13DRAFT_2305292 [Mycena leptocephala]